MRHPLLLLASCTVSQEQVRAERDGHAPETGPAADTALDTGPRPPDPETPPTVTGVVDGSDLQALPADLRLALVPVYFGEGPRIGDPVATTVPDATGAFALQAPRTPPALSDQYQVGAALPLDVSGATYAVLAYAASSPDAAWVAGDALYGISLSALLVWLDDTAPAQGWPAGWSMVDAGLAGTYGSGRCLLDTEVPLQWAIPDGFPVFSEAGTPLSLPPIGAPRTLDLSVSVADGVGGRVTALAYAAVFQDTPGLSTAFDVPIETARWAARLDTRPDEGTLLNPTAQLPYSLFVPLRYHDDDGSGAWSDGDTPDGATVCDSDGARILVRHTPPPRSWAGMKLLDCQGGRGGWSAVRRTDTGTWSARVAPEAIETLHMDPTACSW